jgi:hypothetical protein
LADCNRRSSASSQPSNFRPLSLAAPHCWLGKPEHLSGPAAITCKSRRRPAFKSRSFVGASPIVTQANCLWNDVPAKFGTRWCPLPAIILNKHQRIGRGGFSADNYRQARAQRTRLPLGSWHFCRSKEACKAVPWPRAPGRSESPSMPLLMLGGRHVDDRSCRRRS